MTAIKKAKLNLAATGLPYQTDIERQRIGSRGKRLNKKLFVIVAHSQTGPLTFFGLVCAFNVYV